MPMRDDRSRIVPRPLRRTVARSAPPFMEELAENAGGMRVRRPRSDSGWRSLGNDATTAVAPFRAKINNPVCFGHDIEIVLDDDH